MPSYTFTSEQAKSRTITTVEEAKRVIIATATVHMLDKDELLEDKHLKEIAEIFGLCLNDVEVGWNEDPNDYPFNYKFKEAPKMKKVELTQLEVLEIASVFNQLNQYAAVVLEAIELGADTDGDEIDPIKVLENIRKISGLKHLELIEKAMKEAK